MCIIIQIIYGKGIRRTTKVIINEMCKQIYEIKSLVQKALEACTDYCKDENDMQCINKCGSKYLKDLHTDFKTRLQRYN